MRLLALLVEEQAEVLFLGPVAKRERHCLRALLLLLLVLLLLLLLRLLQVVCHGSIRAP